MDSIQYSFMVTMPQLKNAYKPDPKKKEKLDEAWKWYLTGLTDGDGSFAIKITNRPKRTFSWAVELVYTIGFSDNVYNQEQQNKIRAYFGGGYLYFSKAQDHIIQQISAFDMLEKVITHLTNQK